jgi:predicted amidohydrolase
MSKILPVAVVQLCSRQQVDENLDKSVHLVEEAHRLGARLVVLPENFPYIGRLAHKVTLAEPLTPDSPGPILGRMIALARRLEIHLLAGGIPIRSEGAADRFYNTSVLLGPEGAIVSSYRKIHLFDINIPGGAVFTESDHVLPGDRVVAAEALGTTIGFSICYDLRFPELYRELARRGAEIVTVPAAFTLHTGKDHWFPLLRARAIENQTFVLAAAQHGRHNEHRTSYGKACIIDPWGAVLAQVPDTDGVAMAELDLGHLARVRRELPCLEHRRL